MNKKIAVKRIYDTPEPSDGVRVLVDRLWPRGVSKADAKIDVWVKELAPSTELRKWYHEKKDPSFAEFSEKYKKELSTKKTELHKLKRMIDKQNATLLTATKEVTQSHPAILKEFL